MGRRFKILALVCVMFIISGCAKIKFGINIINEDTMETRFYALIEEETYDLLYDLYGEDPFEDLLEEYEAMDADIEEIEEEHDGDNYIGYEIIIYDEDDYFLNEYLEVEIENGKEVYILTIDVFDLNEELNLDLFLDDDLDDFTLSQMRRNGLEFTMSFTLPYAITEATFGDIDGNTVTIDLIDIFMEGGDELVIVASERGVFAANTLLYIAGAVIVVAAGAIVAILIYNKKKKTILPKTVNNDASLPINQNPENKGTETPMMQPNDGIENIDDTSPEVAETIDATMKTDSPSTDVSDTIKATDVETTNTDTTDVNTPVESTTDVETDDTSTNDSSETVEEPTNIENTDSEE